MVEKSHAFKSTKYNLLSIKTPNNMSPGYLHSLFSYFASFSNCSPDTLVSLPFLKALRSLLLQFPLPRMPSLSYSHGSLPHFIQMSTQRPSLTIWCKINSAFSSGYFVSPYPALFFLPSTYYLSMLVIYVCVCICMHMHIHIYTHTLLGHGFVYLAHHSIPS